MGIFDFFKKKEKKVINNYNEKFINEGTYILKRITEGIIDSKETYLEFKNIYNISKSLEFELNKEKYNEIVKYKDRIVNFISIDSLKSKVLDDAMKNEKDVQKLQIFMCVNDVFTISVQMNFIYNFETANQILNNEFKEIKENPNCMSDNSIAQMMEDYEISYKSNAIEIRTYLKERLNKSKK